MSQTNISFSYNGYYEYLDSHADRFNDKLSELVLKNLPQKIWSKDYRLWSDRADEISNRLGWLELPDSMEDAGNSIDRFSREVTDEGFKNVLLIGMGGSSLAPGFFEKTFLGKLPLTVIDMTDPESVKTVRDSIQPEETLIIVSTKSGTTVETISLMNYFYHEFYKVFGNDKAGNNFAAITDPGSNLEKTAKMLNFRKIFLNDPNVGGRFSALSHFGLVPASLVGVDIRKLLKAAKYCAELSVLNDVSKNIPLRFGTLIGYFAAQKIDKLTIITSKNIRYFAYWIEQLVAESTGKKGIGILPVIEEDFYDNEECSKDRFFVFIKIRGDEEIQKQLVSALNKNLPVVCIELNDLYDFGGQFFSWEFATVVCGVALKINPFDQPDVESSKKYARDFVDEYRRNGILAELKPLFENQGMEFFADSDLSDIESFRDWLFQKIQEGGYLSIQAFIVVTCKYEKLLRNLARSLSSRFKVPVTFGFGPRYLHSTGQLHKGDSGKGVFLQFVSNTTSDIPIPDEPLSDKSSISFGVLNSAQSLGDYLALTNRRRNVVRINLGNNVEESLIKFAGLI